MTRWLILLVWLPLVSTAQTPTIKRGNLGHGAGQGPYSFVHITDTHIGEHTSGRDHGTRGFINDSLTGNENGIPLDRLRSSVKWLNANHHQEAIRFVLLTGDITDSGEKSELLMARQVLDSLRIPYVPLMGNHDVWPYNWYQNESPKANGDSLMNEVFGPVFASISAKFNWDNGTRAARYVDPVSGNTAFLQNFSFTEQGIRYVFLDLNPRYHVRLAEPGIGAEASTHNHEGGTLPFLRAQLEKATQANQRVVILSHHPPISLWATKHLSLTPSYRRELVKVLRPHRKAVLGWFCGHLHRWARYRIGTTGIRVFETKANKEVDGGAFRVMEVGR